MKINKVLIIDDEKVVRQVLSEFLLALGYQTEQLADGNSSLDAIQNPEYSVIFTDIRMPGIDGINLTRKVSEQRPEVPVIIVTGHGSAETCEEAIAAGAFDFLRKPFHFQQIADIMQKIEKQ
jgi:DNA-binding NtrC family response regulator